MKLISARVLRNKSGRIWKELKKERQMVVTSNGKPVAVFMPIEESDFEQTLAMIRQAQAMSALYSLHLEAVKNGTSSMAMEEITAAVDKARAELYR